jgi:hypothetical protein
MNMFGRGDSTSATPSQPAPPQIRLPELVTFNVWACGESFQIQAHGVQVEGGCLTLLQGVFVDEACTQVLPFPVHVFAPGTWTWCKTDYRGFSRKSDLVL